MNTLMVDVFFWWILLVDYDCMKEPHIFCGRTAIDLGSIQRQPHELCRDPIRRTGNDTFTREA